MLTTVNVRGVTVTAEQVGHFAVHPAIMHDTETGEFFLSADTWIIYHIPSGSDLMALHESDPIEWPGHPLAIDMDNVRDFLQWIEPFADWSMAKPELKFPSEDDKQAYRLFSCGPVFWRRPEHATT